MPNAFHHYATLLADFANQSKDGYAIFSADDTLVCANDAFLGTFNQNANVVIGLTFQAIMRLAFHNKTGPRFDTNDIEQWLCSGQLILATLL